MNGLDDLRARLTALRDAATLLATHGVAVEGADVEGVLARAEGRLRHGTDHTVVALAGSTGSGKSSLLNALAEADVARSGVTRPTTAIAQAVTFGRPAEGLLGHLEVSRSHHLAGGGDLDGLVLLDLPDFDSVASAHRAEADRLILLVDLMVWVTDPQKYADEALHAGYLRPLASHAEVMQVVLNKVDTIDAAQVAACVADLSRLLAEDGLEQLDPIATSTVTGDGVDELRGVLAAEVTARAAAVERIGADLTAAAQRVRSVAGVAGTVDLATLQQTTAGGLADAAGVGDTAVLVGAQYQRDAVLAVGWPPLRILRRWRRPPLEARRTSSGSAVARSQVSRALRAAGEQVEGAGDGWGAAARSAVRDRADAVVEALDTQTTRGVQAVRTAPRWWTAARRLQQLWLLALLLGVVWLVGVALAEALLLVDLRQLVPRWRGIAAPTLLAAGGLLLGLLTALVGRWLAAVGARRRAARAREELTRRVADVVATQVIDPLGTLLADAREAAALLDRAEGRP